MQTVAFDRTVLDKLPEVDVLELGLPCSGASTAGRAKKGTSMPEEHEHVGHLVVAAMVILSKVNPAIALFEQVPAYASSASAAIIRTHLREFNYDIHETMVNGQDFPPFLENRKRWCLVATTKGLNFSWDCLIYPEKREAKFGDIMEDVPPSDPSWSEMKGLKAKEVRDIEAGKGFRMQTIDANSSRVPTFTKGMQKNRSTDPKVVDPDTGKLRIPTPLEHARLKGISETLIAGIARVSKTLAHEMMGQSVNSEVFVEISRALIAEVKRGLLTDSDAEPTKEQLLDGLQSTIFDAIVDTSITLDADVVTPARNSGYVGPVIAATAGVVYQQVGDGLAVMHKLSELQGEVVVGDILEIAPKKNGMRRVRERNDECPGIKRQASFDFS